MVSMSISNIPQDGASVSPQTDGDAHAKRHVVGADVRGPHANGRNVTGFDEEESMKSWVGVPEDLP